VNERKKRMICRFREGAAKPPPPSPVFKQVALLASFRGKAGFPHMSKPCLHKERSAISVFDSYIASCYA
jgi:hypothetical protein